MDVGHIERLHDSGEYTTTVLPPPLRGDSGLGSFVDFCKDFRLANGFAAFDGTWDSVALVRNGAI
ncbi:hypothetical protein [Rubneribacter badeniensis]